MTRKRKTEGEGHRMAIAPLVSCIMVTRDRRRFAPRAISCFQAQTLQDAELVILDHGADKIGDLVPEDERIRYLAVPEGPQPLGRLRELAVEAALGSVLVTWDDDDWSAPQRLAAQVAALDANPQAVVAALCPRMLLAAEDGAVYLHDLRSGSTMFDGTMALRRSAWSPRPEAHARDLIEVLHGISRSQWVRMEDPSWFLAFDHGGSTGSPGGRDFTNDHYRRLDVTPDDIMSGRDVTALLG